MSDGLHLVITTPSAVLADAAGIRSLRAEDASGGFGILPGHADLLTVLPASVIRWRDLKGKMHFCAVSGGIVTVSGGSEVSIACRQGTLSDDLTKLEEDVKRMRSKLADVDRCSRVEQARMHANAVRQLMKYLRPGEGRAIAPTDGKAEI
ncbi:F-type H+-transporting ATPase subunit epsilon [Rhizobium petrolearium]|uniref:F0F1 ATP synthase subunit epsilon n=1 Tax=Neorhizobium petrolearium TaxID=515361 RepID=UPI001AE3A5D4|nr:F0F1 ATP synthase subunit epsilon [Neorhizobium petrolearium]MBP1847797.1 F-type H+-transporting ATPase subunit epsilon [Neorhizobium petrolearium]